MKIVIFGFGHAGQAYSNAIKNLNLENLLTVVDTDPQVSELIPTKAVFFDHVPEQKFDLAIISTPPKSHLDLYQQVANFTNRIILEKPFALNPSEIKKIFNIAKNGDLFFSIHAGYGKEVDLAIAKLKNKQSKYPQQISQLFCDPYCPNGPQNLGGAFWDSIFNALCIINKLWDDVSLRNIKIKTNQPELFELECLLETGLGDLIYSLSFDWQKRINLKFTEISSFDRNDGILINHSQQCVSDISGQNLAIKPLDHPRLSSHYADVINDCLQNKNFKKNNQFSLKISQQVIQIYNSF